MLDHSQTDALALALGAAGFRGEVEADTALRAAMATDNSVYQITPDLVVAPRDENDLQVLLEVLDRPEFASVALTGRGGGTGTNGQSLNRGVVVDMRRHMNGLITVDAEQGWADVQPGMVLDDLNDRLRASGWFFAPETSTSTRCTIGGMVSTDASGKGSRIYGKTSDNILGLEIAHAKGILSSMAETPDWARDMLTRAEEAARTGREAFIRNTPRLNRRFTGYDLERACPPEGGFEWWRLFLGAEGTLGLISRIRVKLRRIEPEKRLLVVAFDSFRAALQAASPLLEVDPTAVEVMDETVQELARKSGILNRLPEALRPGDGQPLAYLFIEFNGQDPAALQQRIANCRQLLASIRGVKAMHLAGDLAEIRELWAVRSAGVGLLGKVDGAARPVAFVEDTVVPPENLPAFVDEFLAVLTRNGLGFGIYGHIDVGCLHIRPALNLDQAEDRERLVAVSDAVYALTRKYGGIFWGEHGKGVRGAYLQDWIGPQAYRALQGVKAAFDPQGRYNPGKLVSNDAPVMGIATTPFRSFNVPDSDPLHKAFRCNGNAQCLSYAASVPMCPSFKATADLRHSPKGRADALRAWHQARNDTPAERHQREADLMRVLDGCLGCKACASSCPVQVDIPSMRSAFYEDYFSRHRRPLAEQAPLLAERFSPYIARMSPLLSAVWPVLSRLGEHITDSTDMPRRLARGLPAHLRLRRRDLDAPLPDRTVILVQDWFTALFDPDTQRDVVAGFQALGYKPRMLQMQPAGKAAYAAGDFRNFRTLAKRLAKVLHRAAATGAPLIAFEPAFGMMLRQEYVKEGIRLPQIMMAQEFLSSEAEQGRLPRASQRFSAKLLAHCTESTATPQSGRQWAAVFEAIGIALETPATGCCGMAGLFGHHKRHQEVSRKLFDMSWRQHMTSDKEVVATGFSCRCQSERLSDQSPRHPLGLIARVLGGDEDLV
ncbi:FAD-binding and (Fe-S)-binding domain-containing protein [Paracoccus seriniphilus]|uniref:FAD-binding and (Fe-S)-binding domain-containing protein n=1 Tax=Paracoccus seriniphilus TaxID=184748 RepID=UPI0035692167